MHDFEFAKATEGMTAEEVLNYYRNLYHAEPLSTERGIIANALNDILPRMIVPPCKVGDTLYYIDRYSKNVETDTVKFLTITKNGCKPILVRHNKLFWEYYKFGKTVFLTREEAEQVLAERKVL